MKNLHKDTSIFRKSLLSVLALMLSGSAYALTINTLFIADGESFTRASVGVGETASSSVTGGGNLTDVFDTAASWWEAAILDTHVLDIEYGWQSLTGGALAAHNLGSQGGTPHRETSATIRFDSDGSSAGGVGAYTWFMDITPTESSEFINFSETEDNLGGGLLNTGRNFADATGVAVGSFDLFTIALHEIGHALGLSSANDAFAAENADSDIDVDFVTEFAGSVLPTYFGAHLKISPSLLSPSVGFSQRNMLSGADILANCEISEFSNCIFNPALQGAGVAVPLPATMALLLLFVWIPLAGTSGCVQKEKDDVS